MYHAALEEMVDNRFVVHFAYGRCGATLTTGTKTNTPLNDAATQKIYDKLVKSKTADGQQPVHIDTDMRETGVQCPLGNFIEEAQVAQRNAGEM